MTTPVTIITGFLGTGKTTAILSAFEHRPENERWAVIVNEFGEIGLDGAILGGIATKEIPGGCICCTAGVALKFGIVEVLKTQKPDRLLIEPTGLADPGGIIDLLRQPGLSRLVTPRATIGLINPRHLADPRRSTEHEVWHAQIALSDVLVGGFADETTPEEDAAFEAFTADLWPQPLVIARRSAPEGGTIDPEWFDLDPYPRHTERHHHAHDHGAHEGTAGWIFPRTTVFDKDALVEVLTFLLRPNPILPDGLLRLKGIFRTRQGWLLVQGTSDTLRVTPVHWRRDSRVEFIAPTGDIDWDSVEAKVRSAFYS